MERCPSCQTRDYCRCSWDERCAAGVQRARSIEKCEINYFAKNDRSPDEARESCAIIAQAWITALEPLLEREGLEHPFERELRRLGLS